MQSDSLTGHTSTCIIEVLQGGISSSFSCMLEGELREGGEGVRGGGREGRWKREGRRWHLQLSTDKACVPPIVHEGKYVWPARLARCGHVAYTYHATNCTEGHTLARPWWQKPDGSFVLLRERQWVAEQDLMIFQTCQGDACIPHPSSLHVHIVWQCIHTCSTVYSSYIYSTDRAVWALRQLCLNDAQVMLATNVGLYSSIIVCGWLSRCQGMYMYVLFISRVYLTCGCLETCMHIHRPKHAYTWITQTDGTYACICMTYVHVCHNVTE